MLKPILAYKHLIIVAFLILIADQVSKVWIIQNIAAHTYESPAITLIDGFLYIVHIGNPGAAWGLLPGYGHWLALLGLVSIGGIFYFREDFKLHRTGTQAIFGLMIGGILGNVIDRVLYGHVVDFIDIHLPGYRWPAFNVADSGISIGVTCYIIISLLESYFIKESDA